jgi:hypothetical protein
MTHEDHRHCALEDFSRRRFLRTLPQALLAPRTTSPNAAWTWRRTAIAAREKVTPETVVEVVLTLRRLSQHPCRAEVEAALVDLGETARGLVEGILEGRE